MENNEENKAIVETSQSAENSDAPKKKVHAFHAINGVLRFILNIVAFFLFLLAYSIIYTINTSDSVIPVLFLSVFGFIFAIGGGIVFLVALILTIIGLVRLTAIIQKKEKVSIATIILDVLTTLFIIANGVFIYLIVTSVG